MSRTEVAATRSPERDSERSSRPPNWRTFRRSTPARTVGFWLICLLLALPFIFPVWWMVTSALKPAAEVLAFPPPLWPADPQWGNFLEVFRIRPFGRHYFNSTYIAILVTVGSILVGALAGYGFARIRFRGSSVLFAVLLTGILIADEVTIIPLFRIWNTLGLLDNHIPLIVVPIFGPHTILSTFIMRQAFLSFPKELEEAARIDGLGHFGIFWRIAMPLAKPAIAAVTILSFIQSWNLFMAPLVYLNSTRLYTLPLSVLTYTDGYGTPIWNLQLAAATWTVLPIVVVFLVAQRQFMAGLVHTGVKG